MKTLTKLNIANLKANPARTTATVIGLALSCALIFAIVGFYTSFQFSMRHDAIQEFGDYHVMYENIPGDQLQIFEQSEYYDLQYYSESVPYVVDSEGTKYEYFVGPYPLDVKHWVGKMDLTWRIYQTLGTIYQEEL